MKKSVPIEKVFEAWTALADNRVKLIDTEGSDTEGEQEKLIPNIPGSGEAEVSSSDGKKSYTVRWDGNQYSSDDNSTFWQGYPGYPIIAVLMRQGKLPYNPQEAELWKDINWTQENKAFKNIYSEAVAHIASERGIDLQKSYSEAEDVIHRLQDLSIEIKRKIKR